MGQQNVTLSLSDGALIAVEWDGEREIRRASLVFDPAGDVDSRAKAIVDALAINESARVICPGGLLKPLAPGTYEISPEAERASVENAYGSHPYNRLTLVCLRTARLLGARALMHDPLSSDELLPLNRFSSMARVEKRSRYYACEHDALIWEAANGKGGKRREEIRAIVALVDDTVSVGAHDECRCLDVNDVFGAEGPMGFTCSGDLPVAKIAMLFMKGDASLEQMREKLMRQSGVLAYLGTDSPEKMDELVAAGDEKAILVADALAYQTAKWIGSGALALYGIVDAIILSGKGARSQAFKQRIEGKVGRIAPIIVIERPNVPAYLGYIANIADTPACPVRCY